MKKKRKLRKEAKIIIGSFSIIGTIVLVIFICNINFYFINKHSIHEDALKYQTKEALVYYPNTKNARAIARDIAKNLKKNDIVDYALIPYGDYYMVKYPNGTSYFIDKDNKELVVKELNDDLKRIISDYLRYTLKSNEIDEAYTYDFLIKTTPDKLNYRNVTYEIIGTDFVVHVKSYNCDLKIPIKYLQEPLGIYLGYDDVFYTKPRYISKNRKMICFTFDDGPDMSLKTSSTIVNELDKLDSSTTFFLVGYRLGEKQINFCKESVIKGMEYGSHSQSHEYLTKIDEEKIYDEIMEPYYDLYDGEFGFGYKMKTYRPPYGSINSSVEDSIDLTAVLWNVDSLDWKYRGSLKGEDCVKAISDKVISEVNENDVILFHDIYDTSVEAASYLLEYYIKEGYQVVSASELMEALNKTDLKVFGGQ